MKNNTYCALGIRIGIQLMLLGLLMTAVAWSSNIGPDEFGYTATDDTPYSFVDISATGSAVLGGTDDEAALVNIGFPFLFYGNGYSNLCISSNGLVSFGECGTGTMDFSNQDITGSGTPGDFPAIAPLWFDMTFAVQGAGRVHYQTMGSQGERRFVLQWQNAYTVNGSNGITFQVILHEGSGDILFQYLDVDAGTNEAESYGGSATVGIRDTGGQTNGRSLQWSYKAPVLQNEQAILFSAGQGGGCIDDLTARAKLDKIQLTWTDTGAPGGYNVYRGTAQGGPYTLIANTASTYSTYLDSDLTIGTTYYYVVRPRALNSMELCQSNEASATPQQRIRR